MIFHMHIIFAAVASQHVMFVYSGILFCFKKNSPLLSFHWFYYLPLCVSFLCDCPYWPYLFYQILDSFSSLVYFLCVTSSLYIMSSEPAYSLCLVPHAFCFILLSSSAACFGFLILFSPQLNLFAWSFFLIWPLHASPSRKPFVSLIKSFKLHKLFLWSRAANLWPRPRSEWGVCVYGPKHCSSLWLFKRALSPPAY